MAGQIDVSQGDITGRPDSRNPAFDRDDNQNVVGGIIQAPDGTTMQLSAEEAQQLADAAEAEEEERRGLILELVDRLIDKREQVVRNRRDIDKRWVDDTRQWDGESRLMNTKEFPSMTNDDNQKPPRPHLTRARCDLWESRMIDLIVPTNDPTWDLAALSQEDVACPPQFDPQQWQSALTSLKQDADQRALKMKEVIQDQLRACNASRALRKMCKDACRLGTGLVMGPMNGTHVRRKYNPNASAQGGTPVTVTIEESIIPELREADPRMFFPDMTSSAEKAEFAFYLHSMSETDLWNFAEFPGVDKDEVLAVMDEPCDFGEFIETLKGWNQHSGLREEIDNRHAVWRYTGIVDRKYLEALGMDDEADQGLVCADIWFCNRHILKSKITMLSAVKDFRIPYYVFSPFPIDDTMFGASIAYLCRDSQRTADAAWLVMLHNASVTAGPQIVVQKGEVEPADGKYSIRGPKIWYKKDKTLDINAVFGSINIQSNAEQAMEIFQAAQTLMDAELNTPEWATSDGAAPAQSGVAWAMMSNARTILQRRVCATADDEVLSPMIERFVLWNLLYSDREDIKGDYDVQPLCQSVRLVKDLQNQQKIFIVQNIVANPTFQSMYDLYEVNADLVRSTDAQVENWLKPKQQWQQEQQQAQQQAQQNPQMQLLQAKIQSEQARQQTERLKQSAVAQKSQIDAQGQTEDPLASTEMQKHAMDKQVELHRMNTDLAIAQTKSQGDQTVAAMKLQGDQERINADMRKSHLAAANDLIKSGLDAKTKITTAAMKPPPGTAVPKRPSGSFDVKKGGK